MGLKNKVLLTLTGMLAIVFIVFYFDAHLTLFPHYFHLETIEMNQNLDRVENTLKGKQQALRMYNTSYSQWDNTYYYFSKKTKEYPKDSFNVEATFTGANIDFYLMFDKNGRFYEGSYFDETKKQFLPIPPELIKKLESHPEFIAHPNSASFHSGFVYLNNQLILLASSPVLTSSGKGPIPGSLIMGSIIDEIEVTELSKSIQYPLNFLLAPFATNSTEQSIYKKLVKGEKHQFERINSQTLVGYVLIKDISGRPIGMLKVNLPRTLYAQGVQMIQYFFFILILLGAVTLAAMWWVMRLLVLNRVMSISNQMVLINQDKNFKKRIILSGRDELNSMANAINTLLEIIEMTQEQLKFRISERTAKLIRVSNLNKDLSAQINDQKIVESKLRQDEFALKQIAYFDILTELPNRLYFYELVDRHLKTAAIEKTSCALFFVDLDKFKLVNDTYGHDVGDALLKIFARRLKNCLRNEDVIARLGGDEFIIFIPSYSDRHMLSSIAQKLVDVAKEPITLDNIEINFSLSIGIAIYPADGNTREILIKNADITMYQAKKDHGNNFYFHQDMEFHYPINHDQTGDDQFDKMPA